VDTPILAPGSSLAITKNDKPSSVSQLKKKTEKILASDTPLEFIEKAGIDLLAIYKGLGYIALNADIMAKDRDGDVFVLGADNRSRIMASTLLLELAKHIKDKSVITQVGIFNDPKIVEEANRVLALRNKI
jgi:hypothetical protein